MNGFEGLFSSDYGFRPQGKSAPMSSSKPPSSNRSTSTSLNFDLGSRNSSSSFSDSIFTSKPAQSSPALDDFGDMFAAPARRAEKSVSARADSSFDFDAMFNSSSKSSSSLPVYDKPVYDDDIFEGVPGMKTSSSSGVKHNDEFESISSTSPSRRSATSSGFDDLLGGFGYRESQQTRSGKADPVAPAFDDLIPGFGGSSPTERSIPKSTWSSEPLGSTAKTSGVPFAAPGSASPPTFSSSGVSLDPLEEFNVFSKSGSRKSNAHSDPSGAVFDDLDPFDGLVKSIPSSSPDNNIKEKDTRPLGTEHGNSGSQYYNDREYPDKISPKTVPVEDDLESHLNSFDMSSTNRSFSASAHSHEKHGSNEPYIPADMPPGYEENGETSDEVWLTVSEIPLFTQPTRAPPPSRPPPPRPARAPKAGSSSFGSRSAKMDNEYFPSANSTQHFEDANSILEARTATIDEFDDFAMGRSNGNNIGDHVNWASSEELDMNSDAAASAAAMKETIDRAEAKFRQGKQVRERESTRAARSRESVQLEKDENWLDAEERALKEKERLEQERQQQEREEKEREQRRYEKQREREEKEKEQQRLERERARQAVERANREARERAAAEARLKAERAAVEKANAEARERAERAAVLRAQAEARERAAAEARERAERAAAEAREREARERAAEARAIAEKAEKAAAEAREKEARERASEARARAEKAAAEARDKEARDRAAEARRRAERAAFERAAAEARERAAAEARDRAAAEARDRAAASARAKQQSSDNDLESFFNMGRASSAPRPRANNSDTMFDAQFPSRKEPEVARTQDSTPNMRKASSSANIVDDLSSIFGGVSTSGEFQEIEGESEERRSARLERLQRTQERAAKALAEKNQRDLQAQREQAERHRIAESLDAEIKRWAAGKEGNLRALLATLQYVLWPECGWQPVSLTDLITAAAVKKVYRKATLCIHPDKVQQKGANLQQKYVAEKVFDLLKEAWNKFNSEELF